MKILDDVAEGIVKTSQEIHEFGENRRKERWICYSVLLLVAQIMLPIFLALYKSTIDSQQQNIIILLYKSLAPSAIISLIALMDFSFLYKRLKYRLNINSFLIHICLQIILVVLLVLIFGVESIVNLVYLFCDLPYVRLCFNIISGINIIVSTIYLLITYANQNKKPIKQKAVKQEEKATLNEDELQKFRRNLVKLIRNNAINVCFLKQQWGFEVGEEIQFGFDNTNGAFVFVNERNHHIVDHKKLVYLDYEDTLLDKTNGTLGMIGGALLGAHYGGVLGAVLYGAEGRISSQKRKIKRLIKLYLMNPGNKEFILTFVQIFPQEYIQDNGNIENIKTIADNIKNGAKEIVFRRKIRHIASELDKDIYVNRPFVNDNWFILLKENMSQIKNRENDGYGLFREYVIQEEDYLNDMTIENVIYYLSSEEIDEFRLKQEARSLCFRDSVSSVGRKLKKEIKNFLLKK